MVKTEKLNEERLGIWSMDQTAESDMVLITSIAKPLGLISKVFNDNRMNLKTVKERMGKVRA